MGGFLVREVLVQLQQLPKAWVIVAAEAVDSGVSFTVTASNLDREGTVGARELVPDGIQETLHGEQGPVNG
jgi:hypothetical protein